MRNIDKIIALSPAKLLLAVGVLLACSLQTAHADVLLTLTPATLTTSAGSLVAFSGTIQNTDVNPVFLNSITLNLFDDATTYLSEQPDVFLNNVPLSLAGSSSYDGLIFGVNVSSAAPDNSYFGLVTLQGGPNAEDTNDLVTQNFQVIVQTVTATAPEPASLALCLPALLGSLALVRPIVRPGVRHKRN